MTGAPLLALMGFGMIAAFMALIMTKRLSALVALIVVPLVFAVILGHGSDLGSMVVKGLATVAPTAAVLLFAVLYFGVMIDAGLFDPLVRRVISAVGGDPRRVAMGTAIVAAVVSLDGDGATTAMVTITAFLPVYRRLGMNPLILAVLLGSSNAIINIAPWGGPAARLSSVLQIDPNAIFLPLIPTMLIGLLGVLVLAWHLGGIERKRLGVAAGATGPESFTSIREDEAGLARPRLWALNLLLTLAVLAGAVSHILPLPLVFMIGLSVALALNYPRLAQQRDRIAAHAPNVIAIVSLIFAAAVFTGILDGTGMVAAMGSSFVDVLPAAWGPHLALVTAVASAPMTFFLSNDAFYFGIVPVLSETAAAYGITPAEIARASLLGQTLHGMSPLVAAVYLVAGMLDVDVGAMQRFGLRWALALAALLVVAAVVTGAVPLRGSVASPPAQSSVESLPQ